MPTQNRKPCQDDSCDAIHCARCGGHMLGWNIDIAQGAICSSCEDTDEDDRNPAHPLTWSLVPRY